MLQKWADDAQFEGRVLYLFEAGNEHQGEADAMMEQIKNNAEMKEAFRYENHDFLKKSLLPPLQAADMFIWLFQKWAAEQRKDPLLRELVGDETIARIPHFYHEVSDLSLGMLALQNMNAGIKFNRKYETQTGPIKRYTF